jgi:hypothetical protein
MPMTIQFAPPIMLRSGPIKPDLFGRIGSGILMLWAVVMLSIGVAAHFGAQSSELSAFELLALF